MRFGVSVMPKKILIHLHVLFMELLSWKSEGPQIAIPADDPAFLQDLNLSIYNLEEYFSNTVEPPWATTSRKWPPNQNTNWFLCCY